MTRVTEPAAAIARLDLPPRMPFPSSAIRAPMSSAPKWSPERRAKAALSSTRSSAIGACRIVGDSRRTVGADGTRAEASVLRSSGKYSRDGRNPSGNGGERTFPVPLSGITRHDSRSISDCASSGAILSWNGGEL